MRSSLRFERGFLVACEVKPKHKATMKGVTGDPLWATVEEVDLTWDRPQDGFQHPVLRSLRRLRRVRHPLLKAICESETPVQLEELQVLAYSYEDADRIEDILALLAATRSLPRLKQLHLGLRWPADASSEKLLASPLARQLESLRVDVDAGRRRAPTPRSGRGRGRRCSTRRGSGSSSCRSGSETRAAPAGGRPSVRPRAGA